MSYKEENDISYKDTRSDLEWLEYSNQTSNGKAIVCEGAELPRPLWQIILSAIFAVFIFFFKLCWAAFMIGVIVLACVIFFYWAILMLAIGLAVSSVGGGISGPVFFFPLRLAKVAWNNIW